MYHHFLEKQIILFFFITFIPNYNYFKIMNDQLLQIISQSWFFRYLTEEEKKSIILNSNLVKYSRKDVIFKQSARTSHMMFVLSGLVKVYKEGRNKKILNLNTLAGGDFISYFSIFGDSIYRYSAAAIKDSDILMIDYATFVSIIHQNGTLAMALISRICKTGLYLIDRLMSISHKQLPGRIAEVLLYFSEKIYNSESFDLPLTRQELAEMAGTTKESFIRTITEFRNDKIIELNGRHVEIISMDIIKVLCELG